MSFFIERLRRFDRSLLWRSLLVWLLGAASLSAAESGTLLFLENVSSVVEVSTRGQIGHVAMIVKDDGAEWVYEATPGKVRRLAASDYYAELAESNRRKDDDEKIVIWKLTPLEAYSDEEVVRMREYLDGQVGRRYSVRNYVRTKPGDGIHCAELASSALNASGRYKFEDCSKIHPTALYRSLLATHQSPQRVSLPSPGPKRSWCVRAQERCSRWLNWCGWSCREAWAFCW